MVRHFIFPVLLFALVLSPACNHKSTYSAIIWKPTTLPSFEMESSSFGLDESVLADMVTSVLLNNPMTKGLGQVSPAKEAAIPVNPKFGPFLFRSGDALIVVADSENRFSKWSENVIFGQYTKIWFISLISMPSEEQIVLSNEVKSIPNPNHSMIPISDQNGRIKLTPENMASALSAFSQWEGVHLGKAKKTLTFIGSNTAINPQISASELITAYRAIYEHEAFGEPLFVDMDFNENQKDYMVTFGGGFEDTKPGRALYEADLLLKGLSSGIDPWSNEKPLVDVMCSETNKTSIQRIYCKYLWGYWDKKVRGNSEIDDLIDLYNRRANTGNLLADLAAQSSGEPDDVWEYLFGLEEQSLKDESDRIKIRGYISIPGGGCACAWINPNIRTDCATQCNKEATYGRVKAIADLSSDERSIIKRARDLYPAANKYYSQDFNHLDDLLRMYGLDADNNSKDRRFFAVLSFFSPKIYRFLSSCSNSSRSKVFSVLRKLDEEYGENTGRSQRAKIALLLFMSKEEGFIKDFIALNEEDQMLIAFLASTLLDPKFARLLDDLQFHQPLCVASEKGGKSSKIKSFNSAYTTFVCDYLSRYERPYFAELIRKDFKGYQSAAEIGGKNDWPFGDSMITVRYWFFPGNEVLTLGSADDLNTFLFNRPNMKAQAERMGRRKGPFEDVDHSLKIPGVEENLQLINDHYDELAEMFPSLKELSSLVRVLAFFRWIRYYHSDVFDLEAFANATDFGTPTPRKYPVYETVVALPNGSLMRAVGGVDLHSATQVGFDPIKIKGFVAAMKSAGSKTSFDIGAKTYILAPAINYSTVSRIQTQTVMLDKQWVNISTSGTQTRFSHRSDNKLDWSLVTGSNIFAENESVFNSYASEQSERIAWGIGDSTAKQFTFRDKGKQAELQKQNIASAVFHQHIKSKLIELGEANAPDEILWSLFSIPFKDAKMTSKNQEHIYTFKIDSVQIIRWFGKRDASGQYAIHEFSAKEEQEWFNRKQGKVTLGNSNETKIVGIRLTSNVPIDSLIINDLGYRNDSILNVEVLESRLSTKNIFDWRRMTSDVGTATMWDKDKQSNIILTPSLFQREKGEFKNHDLTNRAFLIETTANLRYKSWKSSSKKRFAFMREQPVSKEIAIPFGEPWDIFSQRVYVLDTFGFNPESRKKILNLSVTYPDRIFVYSTEKMPAELRGGQTGETIWLSGLSEKEIRSRLENAQTNGWFNSTSRIRVFNVNNSVFDLGNNLFVDLPQLRSVGAWPRVLDFDSLWPLLEALVKSPNGKELDTQITELVSNIQREYRASSTPQSLQIARDLEESLFSWEEVRPLDPSSLTWKNY